MIKVKGLNKYFFRGKRNEIHVLNDMTLDFPDKGLVVLLGASGSGKTTLLNVIGGLDSVQQGSIEFDNHVINRYQSSTWDKIRNESIGYIFQNYNLLPQLSVYDNIALVLKMIGINDPAIVENRVNYILNAVNMYPYRKKKSTQLSGGQQQRVAIARALVKNPRVIIADEPTGNLDSKNTLDIMNIIKEISKEKLVVLVTHERDIASIYGDRIIELKDGKVINDYLNESNHEHTVTDENVIYLKDLANLSTVFDDHVSVSLYNDSKQTVEPVKIRLIVKNRTLYLDVDSSIQKVKLLDQSSNLVIKDEHYVKKNKEELLETSFKSEALDNKDVQRQFKTIVSIKQVVMLAIQKIIYSSRKGKLMLFAFILSGAVIGVVVAMAAATIIPDYSYLNYEADYIRVQDTNYTNKTSYPKMLSYGADDSNYYVNTLGEIVIEILDPLNENEAMLNFGGRLDLIDHASRNRLIKGRMAVADDEIMITSRLADEIVDTKGPEYGIWSYSHLLLEQFSVNGRVVKVTGVLKSDIKLIYASRAFTNLHKMGMVNHDGQGVYYTNTLYLGSNTITHGTLPTGNQVVISSAYHQFLYGGAPDNAWPKTIHDGIVVSGVFTDTNYIFITSDSIVERTRFNSSFNYYVLASNQEEVIQKMTDDNLTAISERIYLKNVFNQQMVATRVSTSIVTLFVIGFTLIGFYFIMHSSMVSRIYEISVYRALGMKKSEIFLSFLVEILILSTISSAIGFILSSVAMFQASQSFIGTFRLFIVNPLTIFVGVLIVYGVNVLGGMYPIFLLLRKTPAQILSQYDI
ncbi:MAG: ABC transporter ATP-binding protein/permease [Acholeplasmataceae bacterium]|nr:ABC transporter ATP-binding protein/permease [Acholeplasmataceae bacterium]